MLVKLGDVFTIGSGGTPSKRHPEYYGGNIPWVKTGDLGDQYIYSVDECITEEGLKHSSAHMYAPDTVLVAMYGATIGATSILKIAACTNQACAAFLSNNKVIPEYLYYFLLSKKQRFIQDGVGGAQPNISATYLKGVLFPLRTYEKQSAIVDNLSLVTEVIKQRKFQLQTLDQLIKARFVEMFGDPEFNSLGWPIKQLSELCTVGSSKRIYQDEQSTQGIPFWRISDLVSKMDTGVVAPSLYIPEARYDDLKEQSLVPEPGDILVTSRGTLGRCYIVSKDDRFYFQDGMISWLSNYAEQVTPLYIQYLFDMPGFRKQIDSMQAGSTVAYLSIAMLKKLNVMLPDLESQNQFSTFVSQVDKSKAVIQAALDRAQTLFDSLMQQYFG